MTVQGAVLEGLCIISTSWEKENVRLCIQPKAWKGEGEGDYSAQRNKTPIKHLWLTACSCRICKTDDQSLEQDKDSG